MNAKENAKGAITAITLQDPTAAMALTYGEAIINAARTVDEVVMDVEEDESWERLKVHAVPLVRYMGKGTEGLEKMGDKIHVEDEGVEIPVQVRWLANPHSIRDRRQKGEISASSVAFVVKWDKLAWRLIKEGIKGVGVWYRVKPFMNVGPDSRSEHWCGWGHIEIECSGKRAYGYCSGPHRTSTHKCNVIGCSANQGTLCSHMQEKYPNCKGNHIAFSSRCAKKMEATREAWEWRRREPARQTSKTAGPISAANRTALGLRARVPGGGERSGSEEEMANAQEGGAETEDVTLVQSTTPSTTATPSPSATGIATAAGAGIEPITRTGVVPPPPNVESNAAQLCKVVSMDHGRAADWGGMDSGCIVSTRATDRKSRKRNQPLSIR
jgi:hypothetical protein